MSYGNAYVREPFPSLDPSRVPIDTILPVLIDAYQEQLDIFDQFDGVQDGVIQRSLLLSEIDAQSDPKSPNPMLEQLRAQIAKGPETIYVPNREKIMEAARQLLGSIADTNKDGFLTQSELNAHQNEVVQSLWLRTFGPDGLTNGR